MLDRAFLEWLREATEARWRAPSLRDAGVGGLNDLEWQPGTRWRGGVSNSDLEILEAMFSVRLPPAYRLFLRTLHTPDPPMVGARYIGTRVARVEGRLFTDWTGQTPPIIDALERPLDALSRAVGIGRWHPAWGERPARDRDRVLAVRRLAAGGPRLLPLAGQRYIAVVPGRDDGPVLAVHGVDVAVVAPNLRAGLLRELSLDDPGPAAARAVPSEGIPFWGDVVDGLPWQPLRVSPEPGA